MCNGSAAASITLRDAVQLISGCDTGNDAQDADVKIHRKKKIAVLLLYMLYLVEMLAVY